MSDRFERRPSGILALETPMILRPAEGDRIAGLSGDPFYQRLAREVIHKEGLELPVGVLLDAEAVLMRALYGQRVLAVQAHGDDRTAAEGTLQQLRDRFNMEGETVLGSRGGGGTDFTGSVIRRKEKMEGLRLEEEVRASEISGLVGIYELKLEDGDVRFTTDTVLNLVYLFRQRQTNGIDDPNGERVAVVLAPESIGHGDHQAMYRNVKAAREISASHLFPELGKPNDPIVLSARTMERDDIRYPIISDITGQTEHIWRVWAGYRTQAANRQYPYHFEGEWQHDALRRGDGAEKGESFEIVNGYDRVFSDESALEEVTRWPIRVEPDNLPYIRVRS